MQWVDSTFHTTSERGVSSTFTADGAHLGCQQSTELTPTGRFKWMRPFCAKDKIWFLRVCHHISTGLYCSFSSQDGYITDQYTHDSCPSVKLYNFTSSYLLTLTLIIIIIIIIMLLKS